MKAGRSLVELATEIERQAESKRDYIADTRSMDVDIRCGNIPVLTLNGGVYQLNGIAHDQIGAHTGIPAKYYDKMLAEQPALLASNVNTWFNHQPAKRMVRTLDGTARAFLSNKYRRIDNQEIAEAVLPIISGMSGATVESCEITERRMYIKVLYTSFYVS